MVGMLPSRQSKHALDPRSLSSFTTRLTTTTNFYTRATQLINPSHLPTPSERTTFQLYLEELTSYLTNAPYHRAYLCCINRLEGPHTDLPRYASYLPLATSEDVSFYVRFLEAIAPQLDEVTVLLRTGLSEGRTPARVSLETVPEQLRNVVIGEEMEGEVFLAPLREALRDDDDDDDDDSSDLWDRAVCIVQHEVVPAFLALADFVEMEYMPFVPEMVGVGERYPEGMKFYADCLAFHTTTRMTFEEIHEWGVTEVERIGGLMEDVAREAGYESADDYNEYLRTAEEFEPKSAEWLLSHYRDITMRIYPELLKVFRVTTLPRFPFQIIPTPTSNAPVAPSAYYLSGASDGSSSRPGTFYVNTSNLPARRTYNCPSLALHESIPGHHLQGSIAMENPNLATFQRYVEDRRYFEAPSRFQLYTSYIEGWALHCEVSLGYELGTAGGGGRGMYTSTAERMGQLSNEMWRACRMVVDTGLHAMGWDYNEAVDYVLEKTALSRHEVEVEVARYVTWPGQACAYKVGEMTMKRLRDRCEEELGDLFDPRDFYDVVLLNGQVTLSMLSEAIEQFIKTKKDEKKVADEEDWVVIGW